VIVSPPRRGAPDPQIAALAALKAAARGRTQVTFRNGSARVRRLTSHGKVACWRGSENTEQTATMLKR
jgi:hypothetical protein